MYVKKSEAKDVTEGEEQQGDRKKNNVRKQRDNKQEPKDKSQNKEIEPTGTEVNTKKEDEKSVAAPTLESTKQHNNSVAEENIDKPSDSDQEAEQRIEEVSSQNGKHTQNHLN